jgi:hypothetical protein
MHNDRSAKLRRRTTALNNLKIQLQEWKDATSDEQVIALLSSKLLKLKDDYGFLENIRQDKIRNCEEQIVILTGKIDRYAYT